ELVDIFTAAKGKPSRVYLTGISEGGLITTLAIEQYPDIYDGGLAAAGPIGDFRRQINYFGDFRVIFDYYFPGLVPGSAIAPPDWLMQNFEAYYQNVIHPILFNSSNFYRLYLLLKVTGAPYALPDY